MIKRKNIAFILIIVVVTVAALMFGMKTKNSFIDNVNVAVHIENADDRILQIDDTDYASQYFDNEVTNINNLYEQSDLVVVVRLDGDRINFSQAVLSEVQVISVLKEPNFKIKEKIKIYEPCNFVHNDYYESLGFYNLMQEGEDYILFLEKLKRADDYKGKENHVEFKLVSTIYSKYDISGKGSIELLNATDVKKEHITYGDIKNRAILSTDKIKLEKYEKLRSEALKLYEKN